LKNHLIWTVKMDFHFPFLGECSVHLPFIKRALSLVLNKIDFGVFIKTKTQFIKLNNFYKFFNTHINHLAQMFFINMTLKCHYIKMFEKIDSFFVF
jgi:hypothetical protein